MKFLGLATLLESLFKSKPTPTPWGIKGKASSSKTQAGHS